MVIQLLKHSKTRAFYKFLVAGIKKAGVDRNTDEQGPIMIYMVAAKYIIWGRGYQKGNSYLKKHPKDINDPLYQS